MRIGGFQKASLIDYPGKICAIVFTQGCNFRCPYCHNPELVYPELFIESIHGKEVLPFLEMRKGLIDGVVITGGEPLLQPDVEDFIKEIKEMGYAVKLDTNGSNPQRLEELLSMNLLDCIAMDYKSPIEKYSSIVCTEVDIDHIRKTLALIAQCGILYEVRTTLFRGLTTNDVLRMMKELNTYGVENYYLQMGEDRRQGSEVRGQKDFTHSFSGDMPLLFEGLRKNFKQYGFRNLNEKFFTELESDSKGQDADNRREDKYPEQTRI